MKKVPSEFRMKTQGEYRGDVTRDTFYPAKQIRRVITQQGRVTLDSDLNEQAGILLHYLECLARDTGGPHFGRGESFCIGVNEEGETDTWDFTIFNGNYYVQGILCENDFGTSYLDQPNLPDPPKLQAGISYLVYLDVWERHVTRIQDPHFQEVALGSADSAIRSQIIWQVKTVALDTSKAYPEIKKVVGSIKSNYSKFLKILKNEKLLRQSTCRLRARAFKEGSRADPCIISPDSRYRGMENQLYRVEVHSPSSNGKPTFKWSRDNSSNSFPIALLSGSTAKLANWGSNGQSILKPGDWVEVIDDKYTLLGEVKPLLQVVEVDQDELRITLSSEPGCGGKPDLHPFLRRWDHSLPAGSKSQDGCLDLVVAKGTNTGWIGLEDGVEILFHGFDEDDEPSYESGDFWLIPARVATGDVEWPMMISELNGGESGKTFVPMPMPPHGISHVYAPLAIISLSDKGTLQADSIQDLRVALGPNS